MKKSFKIFTFIIVVVLAIGVSTTALAKGQTLTHSGTAKYGYTTEDYVSQKNDTTLTCNYASISNGDVTVTAKYGSTNLTGAASFRTGRVLKLPTYSSVRYVRLYVGNAFPYQGTSITTSGNWTLTA